MKRRTVQVTNVEYSSATKSTKMEDVEDTSRVISLTTQKTQIAQPRVENNSTTSTHPSKLINANLKRLYFLRKIGYYAIDNMYFDPTGSISSPILAGYFGWR